MKPTPFDYVRVDTPEEACALLAEYGDDARILAGGQSLVPMLNMRLAQPRVLLDISRCAALDYVTATGARLSVGAAATQASAEWRPGLPDEVPLLAQAFPHISHFQVRSRGTVCGSLAHADPSAELPLCLVALDGEVVLRAAHGERTVRATDFFEGMLQTARQPDELLAEARFPLRSAGTGYAFEEFALRHGDFAMVSVAASVGPRGVRIAVAGVQDRPVAVEWENIDGADIASALVDFAWSLDVHDDAHASAKVRRHWVRELSLRAIGRARENAGTTE